MSPDRFWITLVEVRPNSANNRAWLDSFGDNADGGFVHVMGLAPNPQALREAIQKEFARYGWSAAAFDELEPLSELKSREPLSPAFEDMESELLKTGNLQFSRFFLYPPDETSTADWLAREAEDERLTPTQRSVLGNVSQMLDQLVLPQLDDGIGITGQGHDEIEIHLPHRDESELDLAILVRTDEAITVDYEYGHLHFTPQEGPDWVNQALEFIYGALQGGVRVEIWANGHDLKQSRASILLENGAWHDFPMWSASPDPDLATKPSAVKLLSFLAPSDGDQETEKTL